MTPAARSRGAGTQSPLECIRATASTVRQYKDPAALLRISWYCVHHCIALLVAWAVVQLVVLPVVWLATQPMYRPTYHQVGPYCVPTARTCSNFMFALQESSLGPWVIIILTVGEPLPITTFKSS